MDHLLIKAFLSYLNKYILLKHLNRFIKTDLEILIKLYHEYYCYLNLKINMLINLIIYIHFKCP